MDSITGEATTPDASRAMKRLCRHWSHKYEVQFDDSSGVIQLNDVRLTMHAADDRLTVTLANPAGEVPQRLLGVVNEHLQRMAGDPLLQLRWFGRDAEASRHKE